jgi:hypothetical protein
LPQFFSFIALFTLGQMHIFKQANNLIN